jgi:hypothetical protein
MPSSILPRLGVLLLTVGLLPGCASIISGRYADVSVASNPVGAHVAILDEANQEVASFRSPGVARLRRNRKFLMPARYTATIESPGYETAKVPIRSTANPWVFANIVLGGVAGLAVDGATGAAYRPSPSKIQQDLAPLPGLPPPEPPATYQLQPANHQASADIPR